MNREKKLISLYLYVCEYYKSQLFSYAYRLSNNKSPNFTDEELITAYIFGILYKQYEIKGIYDYIKSHWNDWFPSLPSYQAFNFRLNRLESVFPKLVECILEGKSNHSEILKDIGLLDSCPIILAKSPRCDKAKVGKKEGFADKGYCSSKKIFYHGVKLHIFGNRVSGSIPIPEYISLTPGSEHDLKAIELSIFPLCKDMEIYLDKAYFKESLFKELKQNQNVILYTPVKKKVGQEKYDSADNLFSKAVSKVRQPIESLC